MAPLILLGFRARNSAVVDGCARLSKHRNKSQWPTAAANSVAA
jgi:hypothetical protein